MKWFKNYLRRREYRRTQKWMKRRVKYQTALHIKLLAGTIRTKA